MSQLPAGRRIIGRFILAVGGMAIAVIGSIAVLAQERAGRGAAGASGAYPRLPDAVTRAPDWIETGAPFDVARFFAAPPSDLNAAPLYLDALFEFWADMDRCFAPGPERDRRRAAAAERWKRYDDTMKPYYNDPNAVLPSATSDEFIERYNTGFRKLTEAQRRDRCVFETSLTPDLGPGVNATLPHIGAARVATRIAGLRVQRAIQREDFDAAIRDVETILRLARDFRPRGGLLSQYFAASMVQVVGSSMVPAILASPKLRVSHCDRLIEILASHRARSIDGFAEGIRAEYIAARTTLRDLVRSQPQLAERLHVKTGEPVVKAIVGPRLARIDVPLDADASLARTSPADLVRSVRELDRYYRTLLTMERLPYSGRVEQIRVLKAGGGDDPLSRVVQAVELPSMFAPFPQITGRAAATEAAVQCLVAMRRWQLTHQGLPRALAAAVNEAGLKAIPTDPYDGKPMRLAMIEGQPVIYSVGKDGRDDGGLKDSKLDQRPAGDLIYRLPRVEANRGIRPL